MFSRSLYIVLYFLAWTLFFILARLCFLLYHFQQTKELPGNTVISTFLYGLRMDLSMAAYFTIPVAAMVLAGLVIHYFRTPAPYRIYTAIILLFTLLIVFVDLEAFSAWGFRIDTTPIKYLSSPREAVASISHLPILLIIVVFLVIYVAVAWIFGQYISRLNKLLHLNKHKALSAILVLCVAVALIIPMRGGFQLAPMNQSAVYFSPFHFANIAAINAPWNFLHALTQSKETDANPYNYLDASEAALIADSLHKSNNEIERVIDSNSDSVNLIMIIWESFTEKVTRWSVSGKEVTPYFNLLKNEGIYFNNAYASGDRTDKGLSAVLSGYPALPKMSIIRYPAKAQRLPSLSKLLKQKGYTTAFYYGGEPEFANIKAYLLASNFDQIIEKNSFDKRSQNSKWGAHDHVVMQRFSKDLSSMQQPFFVNWLTLTSHEPYEIPTTPAFSGNDHTTRFLNSHNYTDKIIYEFVQHCKQQPWWNNTLLIIVADHGHPLPETDSRLDDFKIPVLWLGGALSKTNFKVQKIVSQVDLVNTISLQVGITTNQFSFSKNSFDSTANEWAFFSFNDGFGYVQPNKFLLFDNVGKTIINKEGNIGEQDIKSATAIQQFIYQDFLNR